jgi:hypothetical protein
MKSQRHRGRRPYQLGQQVAVVHPFANVAGIIAKGDPPEWLQQGLAQFSDIGAEPADEYQYAIERMAKATDELLMFLPAYKNLPYGLEGNSVVATLLQELLWLKGSLARISKPPRHRPPDIRREICAAVIIEASKLLHGKVEPRSIKLAQACADYWQACTGKESDPENWRRQIERAAKVNHEWICKVLTNLMVQNTP